MPWLSTSQSNASALAIHLHDQDAAAGAGDLPSSTRHTTYEAPWLVPWRALLAAHPVMLDLFVNVIITVKSE